MESDTPRTDAEEWSTRVEADDPALGLLVFDERVVDAKFARELERELAAAKAELVTKTDELAAAKDRIEELDPLSPALELEEALRHMKQEGGGA